ncbi:arginase [Salmonella enterica subsp. enterica]|nr:arginase [Salmonella enterica subsp. enterica serovar Hadar]EAO6252941.1 arginase [Salmonella enterica]EAW1744813.1 arginase [Salmonella enterica subsp. enterica]EBV4333424.1 arginase [Salmonella enterica subsp. enterica serovar Caracas]EBV5165203.1 arginase [Salmonella enterica subsp. enterica serovar Corvallis]EBX1104485.1 arginase [Salmonella enterica subsp. enterica serovar Anatum]EBY4231497.1 arginase [Salmonella enterica subsp. enterica serovar Typhimurium]ECA6622137.1 arginase [Sal
MPGRTRDTDHRQRNSRAAPLAPEKRGAQRHHYSFRKYRADILPGRLSAGNIPPVIPPLVAQYRRIR